MGGNPQCFSELLLSTGTLSLLPTAHGPTKSPISSCPGGSVGEREEHKYHLPVRAIDLKTERTGHRRELVM